jgi:outer membrane protein assembly factor BamB
MRILVLLLAASGVASATDVLTHHNNLARTGAVLDEKLLSPATLKDQAFGRLFSVVVDGQIYAQPLVVTGLAIPGKGTRNVVFVATMRNLVYAFDADNAEPEPLWRVSLGAPMPYDRIPKDAGALLGQYNVRPYIGVTSTPVIDRERQLIYVVAKIAEPQCPGAEEATAACPVAYRIHSLDLATGAIAHRSDIRIPMTAPGIPAEDVARRHLQRAALLLANHKVYAAFGSHQDAPPWQGLVIAFDAATLRQIEPAFCTTPGGEMGGIWQAGNGPAADGEGNLYVMTGNGSFDPDGKQFGSTFLKLSPDLTVLDWFAPATVGDLNLLDVDLGSSGPMLMPDTDEIVGGGKDGKLFVLQRAKLGGLQQHHWPHDRLNPPVQFFQAARPWRITPFSWFPFLFNAGYHHNHGSPVYWNSRLKGPTIYLWPEEDNVRAYHYDARTKFKTKALKGMVGNKGMPGGFLSVSANGKDDGILWAAIPYQDDAWVEIVRGTLRAFDANTLQLLWSSDGNEPADNFDFAKYVPPTVANGKVYLPTFSDRLNVYGLHAPNAAARPKPPSSLSKDPRHRGHVKGASGHAGHGKN